MDQPPAVSCLYSVIKRRKAVALVPVELREFILATFGANGKEVEVRGKVATQGLRSLLKLRDVRSYLIWQSQSEFQY